MKEKEQRRFIRFDALHLLDYIILDEDGNPGRYSMGRTMDVSIDGIKLETKYKINLNSRILVTVGLEDDLIDLEGQISHSAMQDGMYVSGVTFLRINKDGRRILARYVEAFRQRKEEILREMEEDT